MTPPSLPLNQWIALALLVVMGVLWGLQFAMLKIAAEHGLSEINILMTTLVLLSIAFLIILSIRKSYFRITIRLVKFLFVIGILGYVLPLLAALYAAPHIPAGILTLIATLAPAITIITALLMRTEPVSLARMIAVVFGTLAVLLVLWPEIELPHYGNSFWIFIALIVPVCYGIESIYIAAFWPSGMNSLQAVTGETVMAALMFLPVYLVYGDTTSLPSEFSAGHFAIMIFVLAGVVESLLYFYLIEKPEACLFRLELLLHCLPG